MLLVTIIAVPVVSACAGVWGALARSTGGDPGACLPLPLVTAVPPWLEQFGGSALPLPLGTTALQSSHMLLVLGWGRSTVRAMWGASATVWVLARVAGVGAPLPLLPCLPVLLRQVMLREQNSDGVRGSPMAPLWGGDAVMEGSRVLGKAHPQIHEFHHDGTAAECLCSVSPH